MDEQVAQALVDFMSWLAVPFAAMLAIEWVVGLFRRD